jgi:acetyl/propionyl-CoA carboxylase alpha subunit/acetyl-CoA carboxylase carboxyltransferase component
MFNRIAIVNRGEAAMRLIRAAREFQLETGHPLTTIAFYTDVDRNSMFVRAADEAVRIASPDRSAYLDYDVLEQALRHSRAEAVWVGWGFVSEDPEFADRVAKLGLIFIGPTGDVMRRLGDKIGAKRLAEQVGVPVAPWSGGPVATPDEALAHAETVGYPLMIKAAAGGGGRGIRRVADADGLTEAFVSAQREAANAFGDDTLFIERVVSGGRHVEVQMVADGQGGVWALGVRDCSIQRRNQKVIEESASTALGPAAEQLAKDGAVALAAATGYRGVGTVEYLYQPEEDRLAFLEVNTRLQVEHPVTEITTGVDLVKLQLVLADGGRLEGEPPPTAGHAIEVRLNAEDPERGFAPAPGTVAYLAWPSGPGVRVETGVAQGDTIPGDFDSMIAKIIGFGHTRNEARARVLRALRETTVVIRGGMTNKAFLVGLLEHPDVIAGTFDTAWLDRLMAGGEHHGPEQNAMALLSVAVDAYAENRDVERGRFFASAGRGRPQTDMELGHRVDLRLGGASYTFEVFQIGSGRYRLVVDGHRVDVDVESAGPYERHFVVAGQRFRVISIRQGAETVVEVDGLPHRVSQDDGGLVRAPSPGVLVHIAVAEGDLVEADGLLATLESMKIEVALRAPVAGRVREIMAAVGAPVDAGGPLFRLEAEAQGDTSSGGGDQVDFAGLGSAGPDDPRAGVARELDELKSQILGYDFSPEEARRSVGLYRRHRSDIAPGDPDTLRRELVALNAFADVVLLSRNRRTSQDVGAEGEYSPREFFHAFLRTLDATRAGLPPSFEEKLKAAVADYGVDGLERSRALEDVLLWMFLAQQRIATLLPAVEAILDFHLNHPGQTPSDLSPELLDTLDRLIVATQLRHPVVGELARRVRFRLFDEPFIQAGRDETLRQMRDQLALLASSDDAATRAAAMEELVSCPLPLIRLMAGLVDDDEVERRELIEVQTRRYYEVQGLRDLRRVDRDGRRLVTGTFEQAGQPVLVVAAEAPTTEPSGLAAVLSVVGEEVGDAPAAVVDLYAPGTGATGAPSGGEPALQDDMAAAINGALLPDGLRRVTVSVPTEDTHMSRYTFQRGDGGFAENLVLRDLHPMIARRLHLWRLEEFDVRRLPSPEDVYLFEATSRASSVDRRLLALAEVRDLTPLRDASGTVTAIPALEQVLDSCLDGMRRAMATFPTSDQPQWNRIDLQAWPVIDFEQSEMLSIVRALAPRTEGVGLEHVSVQGKLKGDDGIHEVRLRMVRSVGRGVSFEITSPPEASLKPRDAYTQLVMRARRTGNVFPYELIPLLLRAPDGAALGPVGARAQDPQDAQDVQAEFREYDIGDDGEAQVVERPYGENKAAIVFGTVTTPTARYPEGMTRVVVLGDPTKSLGSVSEPECRRIVAAIDLAQAMDVPVEWFAISSGAKIAMDSGTENLDWVGRVLRRIIEFTQAGGEINVVVTGINVGAQPYWNAEATMLMHTKGILVMTPDSAMVLTGKQALEYSGGVAAEDNFGIGGYDRIMGPNGQGQYWAPNLYEACRILMAHYEYAYVAPGQRFGRRALTSDPTERDVQESPHHFEGTDFTSVGDIFSRERNADRKKGFDIRSVMRAVIDRDCTPLERWAGMFDAETAVIYDAFLGGYPITLIGIESRPVPRLGFPPPDGPESWSGGTLFPLSSKKVARAINAASGNRPVVVLANLSGFDGSPESLRRLQLEYGAEIGRAIVNFEGPIVFCVISRYHGGAFVVFSGTLNDAMEVVAVDGSYASVIGGGPAAAVVFGGEVRKRTEADPRLVELAARISEAPEADQGRLRAELGQLRQTVRAETQAAVAAEFDQIHTIERAREVGSVDAIISPSELRPYLVAAVEQGRKRADTASDS